LKQLRAFAVFAALLLLTNRRRTARTAAAVTGNCRVDAWLRKTCNLKARLALAKCSIGQIVHQSINNKDLRLAAERIRQLGAEFPETQLNVVVIHPAARERTGRAEFARANPPVGRTTVNFPMAVRLRLVTVNGSNGVLQWKNFVPQGTRAFSLPQ
jgi:hypothetical protein